MNLDGLVGVGVGVDSRQYWRSRDQILRTALSENRKSCGLFPMPKTQLRQHTHTRQNERCCELPNGIADPGLL
jgi:hypothetical protein